MSADPNAVMEVLQRIHSMQVELLAKLDKIGFVPQMTTPTTSTGMGSMVGWDYEASRAAKLRLCTQSLNVENNTGGRVTVCQHIQSPTNGWGTSPDVLALHAALGWRRKVQSVFKPQHDADWLTRFASGPVWAALSVTIIVINTVFIGFEIQSSTVHHLQKALNREGNWAAPDSWDDSAFGIVEIIFLAWILFEVLVNAYAQKWDFWKGTDWAWNMFDLAVIVMALISLLLDGASVGFLRVARLLRLGKILRAFRVVKFLRSIRTMLLAMSGSIMHLFSALLVMCLCMFMVALIIMQGIAYETEVGGILEGITNSTGTNPRALDMFSSFDDGHTLVQQVYILHGGIGRTIMTLFMTVTGGIEWRQAAYPMVQVNWLYGLLWTCYTLFMVFGMLNVLTGIFVDAAIQVSASDRDNMIQTQLEEKHSLINMIREVFETADTDHSGFVSKEEFSQLLKDSEMMAYLEAMGIDSSEASGLFRLLDDDGTGVVDIDEFVTGFLRLKGSAKAVDMVMLLYENRKVSKKLNQIIMEARTTNYKVSSLRAEGMPSYRQMVI